MASSAPRQDTRAGRHGAQLQSQLPLPPPRRPDRAGSGPTQRHRHHLPTEIEKEDNATLRFSTSPPRLARRRRAVQQSPPLRFSPPPPRPAKRSSANPRTLLRGRLLRGPLLMESPAADLPLAFGSDHQSTMRRETSTSQQEISTQRSRHQLPA